MKRFLKFIYNTLPFKKNIFILLKIFFTPPQSIYQHLHFTGEFKVDIDPKRNFKIMHYGFMIENEIFWKGIYNGWEKYSMRLWKDLCEHANVIFDVGANTGIYSLVAKTTNANAKVYAFEPVERVYRKLDFNIALNNYDITTINKAVSESNGTAIIYDTSEEHILSVAVNKNISLTPENTFPVEINTITLDTFISTNNIKELQLIKIDVEMHEVEALKGFKKNIKKFEPTILIELLDDKIGKEVQGMISGMGYLYFNIDERSGIRQVSELGKSDYYNFLICKPEVAKKIDIWKYEGKQETALN